MAQYNHHPDNPDLNRFLCVKETCGLFNNDAEVSMVNDIGTFGDGESIKKARHNACGPIPSMYGYGGVQKRSASLDNQKKPHSGAGQKRNNYFAGISLESAQQYEVAMIRNIFNDLISQCLLSDERLRDLADCFEQLRLKGIRKLSTIALALGIDRISAELVPVLGIGDSTDKAPYDHDVGGIFLILAHDLGSLTLGPESVGYVMPPLETLASVDETVVREAAVKSLRLIAEKYPIEALEQYIVPVVKRLASGDLTTSRSSACGLIGVCYRRLPLSFKGDFKELLSTLTRDDSLMVRVAATSNLGELNNVVESNLENEREAEPTTHVSG